MTKLRLFGDVHGDLDSYIHLAKGAESSIQLGDLGFKYESMNHLDPAFHAFVGGNHDRYDLEKRDFSPDDPLLINPRERFTVINPREKFYLDDTLWFNTRTRSFLPDEVDEDTVFEFSKMPPHYLGNFGTWKIPSLNRELFFVRGAWSIDLRLRIREGYLWYPREQLSPKECAAALALYEEKKPDFVVSHAAPIFVLDLLKLYFSGDGNPFNNATNRLFELMHKTHAPRLWVFAHYHQTLDVEIRGTRFVCLNMHPLDGWWKDVDENLNFV